MNGKKEVEHDFIEAAKAKMAILKKFSPEGSLESRGGQFPATI